MNYDKTKYIGPYVRCRVIDPTGEDPVDTRNLRDIIHDLQIADDANSGKNVGDDGSHYWIPNVAETGCFKANLDEIDCGVIDIETVLADLSSSGGKKFGNLFRKSLAILASAYGLENVSFRWGVVCFVY